MNNAAEKNARILIVDDSEMNRDMLSDMLSDDYDIVERLTEKKRSASSKSGYMI